MRDLGTILGREYTQKKLARELGVSEVAIKRIENGSLQLSTEMKGRIAGCTGVDAESLDSGKFTIAGRPYNSSSFRLFRLATRTRQIGETKAELHRYEVHAQLQAIEKIRTLINAAADRNKFHVVIFLLDEWLRRTMEEFGLWDAFFKCAKTQGIPTKTLKMWQQVLTNRERMRTRTGRPPIRQRRMRRKVNLFRLFDALCSVRPSQETEPRQPALSRLGRT